MKELLIGYSTSEGQTLKIAQHVADIARRYDYVVDIGDVAVLKHAAGLSRYDAVILGASVHAGKHQPSMVQFAKRYAEGLKRIPSAFLSVSLTSAKKDREHLETADGFVNDFLTETAWLPDRVWLVAGALPYRKYSLPKRLIMKQIVKGEGGDSDTSRNYEYTDWDALEDSVEEFLRYAADEKSAHPEKQTNALA